MTQPNETELRATLAALDDRQKKIVGGVIALMFQHAEKVRDREWISEQFTEVTMLAGNFDEADEVEVYVQEQIHPLLNVSYGLFARVAQDLTPRVEEGLSHSDAMGVALSYFGEKD